MATWAGNVLVGKDGTLMTVFSDGRLEIRGKGREGRKRKGDTPNTDRPRVCNLDSERQAKGIANKVAVILGI